MIAHAKETDVLELAYFISDTDDCDEYSLNLLMETIEDGMLWPTTRLPPEVMIDASTDEEMETVLETSRFVSFVQTPCHTFPEGIHPQFGLGFSPEFLQAQGACAVRYLFVDKPSTEADVGAMLQDGLTPLLQGSKSLAYTRQALPGANAPARPQAQSPSQAFSHELVLTYAHRHPVYYEIVYAEEAMALPLKEWRCTSAVTFTLSDIQTLYVATADQAAALRIRHPGYRGTFVVLGEL